jgi:hypothetical protein
MAERQAAITTTRQEQRPARDHDAGAAGHERPPSRDRRRGNEIAVAIG